MDTIFRALGRQSKAVFTVIIFVKYYFTCIFILFGKTKHLYTNHNHIYIVIFLVEILTVVSKGRRKKKYMMYNSQTTPLQMSI